MSYIGITDFTSRNETLAAWEVFRKCGGTISGHLLHVGVMMSRKTLNDIPSKWSNILPPKRKIADIFVKDKYTLNVLHYADYEGVDVARNLEKATMWGGDDMDALQLDMIWPDPAVLKIYALEHPHKQIILQVNSKSLAVVDNKVEALVSRLELYQPFVDYVLLDMSMGRGIGLNVAQLLPYIEAIDKFGIAVAGGLCVETLPLIESLVEQYPGISIDAQSKLRPSGNAMDPIDWSMAYAYLEGAVKIFSKRIE